jgi:hypothetical protein
MQNFRIDTRHIRTLGAAVVAVLSTGACATATPVSTTPLPPARSGSPSSATITVVAPNAVRWPVKTEQHVDLWLHSFAMISTDNAPIPLFRRGYRDSLTAIKNRNNITTSLDANRETLSRRLTTNPALIQAQFLALSFNNVAELRFAIEKFLQVQGDAKSVGDAASATAVAAMASAFPTAADREWLRVFMLGMNEEASRFYDADYVRTVRNRAAVLVAVDSVWTKVYRAKFERFLNNTSQRNGQLLLSLPLGGEGRTSVGPDRQTVIAVTFPGRPADALESVFVFAHEVVGNIVSGVVNDNTTPAQQRTGDAANYIAFGQVQGGLALLQKIAPELAEPYARYYLSQGGKPVPSTGAVAALKRAYPLPQTVLDGFTRQIEIVLAGI